MTSSTPTAIRRFQRILLFAALIAFPFCILSIFIDFHDVRAFPGKDLWPKIAGARRFADGLNPYASPMNPADPESLRTNQIPFNTPFTFLLFMPLRNVPYFTQRLFYAIAGMFCAWGAVFLLLRFGCNGRAERLLCWCLCAAFILCSFSLRLDLERGQYYALILLLATHAAIALRNRWNGWLAALPAAMLILIRPTYVLILVAALMLRSTKWAARTTVLACLLFCLTLPSGGLHTWIGFASAVKDHQASILRKIPILCGMERSAGVEPQSPVIVNGIDFDKGLGAHAVSGTYIGVSIIRFGLISRHLTWLCGFPSPQWISRINSLLLAFMIVGGILVCTRARRRRLNANLIAGGALLWPVMVELAAPERNLYTALLELLPFLFLLLDLNPWCESDLKGAVGKDRLAWLAILVIGVVPPILYQSMQKLMVRELASVVILLILPLSLAWYCLRAISASPLLESAIETESTNT